MKLDSVRDLKSTLVEKVLSGNLLSAVAGSARAASVSAFNLTSAGRNQASFAFGITRKNKTDYKLAVRLQQRPLETSGMLEQIKSQARGEADIRYIGRVRPTAKAPTIPWHRKRQRPLLIGCSLGHTAVTAGTLGCFVRGTGGKLWILSNNHVLANENDARQGDPIIQPGDFDGGSPSTDSIAKLAKFIRFRHGKDNLVDAACAALNDGLEIDLSTLKGLGKLKGLASDEIDIGSIVHKVGRTTGVTRGKVTAIEIDNLVVDYNSGRISFDNQIEIETTGTGAFSRGGDSGSIILNDDLEAVALLFAGSDHGGSSGFGRTFANPVNRVLKDLKVKIAL